MKPKKMTSIRYSDKVKILLDELCDIEDVTMTGMIEILVKDECKRRGIVYEEVKGKHSKGGEE